MSSSKPDKYTKSYYCRDEMKRDQKLDSKRSKSINIMNNVTKAIIENPSSLFHSKFSTLQDFIHIVTNNPSKFCANNKTSLSVLQNKRSTTII